MDARAGRRHRHRCSVVLVLVFALALALTAFVVEGPPAAAVTVDHVLEPGEALGPGGTLRSPDGRSVLAVQDDANVVLYSGGRAVWQTGRAGGWPTLAMQGDGNLVLYGAGRVSWHAGTFGRPGARAALQDDGNLVVYSATGVPLWQSGTAGAPDAPPPFGGGPRLSPGDRLGPGEQLQSADERYVLVMQGDGNLVLYVPGGPRWQSGTAGRPGAVAVMQRDGNLVVYAPGGAPIWQSGTAGAAAAVAVLQDDGNAVVYAGDGSARWQSGTSGVVAPLATVVAIDGGGRSSCAVLSQGSVRCWGRNDDGQLGDGTRVDARVARRVPGLTDATAVTVGDRHACSLLAGGLVRCWGRNDRGQLGAAGSASVVPRAPVAGLSDVRAVAAGGAHSCALVGNGTVRCWGAAVANGQPVDTSVPTEVPGLAGVVSIAAGGSMTCARVLSGGVGLRCWGQAAVSLGGAGGSTSSSVPVEVLGLGEQVLQVDVGPFHSCLVAGSFDARCWGSNGSGQLGTGGLTDLAAPVGLARSGVDAVAVGSRHSCVRTRSSTVLCWGANEQGQAGTGEVTAPLVTPRPVVLLSGQVPGGPWPVGLAAGADHTCVTMSDGRARCWGDGNEGSLGDGSGSSSAVPVEVLSQG